MARRHGHQLVAVVEERIGPHCERGGALTQAGVSGEDAHVYAEGLRRGGTLVTVRVPDADRARVEAILDRSAVLRLTLRPDGRLDVCGGRQGLTIAEVEHCSLTARA
jgi:hypothetical protein